jgi:solute carrier family 25 protein 39/40
VIKTVEQVSPQIQFKMGTIAKQILYSKGILGLFSGLAPRLLKVGPSCGIMIATYEFGKQYLTKL